MSRPTAEQEKWASLKEMLGNNEVKLGPYFSYQFLKTPRRVLFSLSHYKFAAKMIGAGKTVLEVGCSEGLGTLLLAETARKVVATDIDAEAIEFARRSFASAKIEFVNRDILGARLGTFDAVVSHDVIEHIYPENEDKFLVSLCDNLSQYGVCIIGTPNATTECYSSEVSRHGHVNVYAWERLQAVMEKYFHQVFLFSANDELIHTGFYPMAHYLLAMGVCKKL